MEPFGDNEPPLSQTAEQMIEALVGCDEPQWLELSQTMLDKR